MNLGWTLSPLLTELHLRIVLLGSRNTSDSGAVEKVSLTCFRLFTLHISFRQTRMFASAIYGFRGFSTAPQPPIYDNRNEGIQGVRLSHRGYIFR